MPAFAALNLADGLATPVSHSFGPDSIDSQGIATYVDRSTGIAVGYPVVSARLRKPLKGQQNRTYKLSVKVVVPTLEQTSASTSTGIQPAPTKAYDCSALIEFTLPERSVLQNRKDLNAFVKNYLANALHTSMIENLETIY